MPGISSSPSPSPNPSTIRMDECYYYLLYTYRPIIYHSCMILFPFPGLKKGGGRRGFKKKREHLIITNALYFLISNKNHIEKTMVMCTCRCGDICREWTEFHIKVLFAKTMKISVILIKVLLSNRNLKSLNQRTSNDNCYQMGPISEITVSQYCKCEPLREKKVKTCHSASGTCGKKS